ncbi:MAG: hypothetical protein IM319_09335 [Microcystis sp. M113S1]|nr:hypothetical protein [Microcystis sp. M113S1]
MLSPHDKLKNASFLGAFLFIRLKKPMTIITKADKKVGTWGRGDVGTWGRGDVGCGVWGRGDVGCGVWGRGDVGTWGI